MVPSLRARGRRSVRAAGKKWASPPGASVLLGHAPPPHAGRKRERRADDSTDYTARVSRYPPCGSRDVLPVAGPAARDSLGNRPPQWLSTICRCRPGISAKHFAPTTLAHKTSHLLLGRRVRRRLKVPSLPHAIKTSGVDVGGRPPTRKVLRTTGQAEREPTLATEPVAHAPTVRVISSPRDCVSMCRASRQVRCHSTQPSSAGRRACIISRIVCVTVATAVY